MYSAPSLVSNNSTAVSRSFVLKQFQANMPFVSQTKIVCLTDEGHVCLKLFQNKTSWHCCGIVGNEGGSWVHRVVHPCFRICIIIRKTARLNYMKDALCLFVRFLTTKTKSPPCMVNNNHLRLRPLGSPLLDSRLSRQRFGLLKLSTATTVFPTQFNNQMLRGEFGFFRRGLLFMRRSGFFETTRISLRPLGFLWDDSDFFETRNS